MADIDLIPRQKMYEVYRICEKFIGQQYITCAETIYQTDRTAENSLQFIQDICDVVGYAPEQFE